MFVELPISSRTFRRRIDNTFLIIDLKNVNVLQLFQSKLKSFVRFGTKIGQDYIPRSWPRVSLSTPRSFSGPSGRSSRFGWTKKRLRSLNSKTATA